MLNYDEDYYNRYFEKHYNDKLHADSGMEECLTWAKANFVGCSWLDVGAGPTSFFWATAAPANLEDITIADISDFPLQITRELVLTRAWPPAYRDAIHLLARDESHLDDLAQLKINSYVFDGFGVWPSLEKFDSISAFGLLGIAATDNQLESFALSAYRNLNSGGVLLGAAWIFSDAYATRLGGRRQRLKNLEMVLARQFQDVKLESVKLKNDDDYTGIVLFAAKKN